MNPAENYTIRYLETDDVDQYNALLRYTFQVTEEELTALIDATIAEVGATSPREMGKVISAIMATHKGRVDGKALSAAVKARLTA